MPTIMKAAQDMQLPAPARVLLHQDMPPRTAVQTLLDDGQGNDALKLLARLLPPRYAVAWACQCARGQTLDATDIAGVMLAENWVREPGETQRRAALDYAKSNRYRNIGAWITAAVGWSGGSLTPGGHETQAPPSEHLTASATVAAITRMSALGPPPLAERRDTFIRGALSLLGTSTESTEI